jgi:hypothetical protein
MAPASAAAAASFAALVTRAWQPRVFAAALAFFHASEFALAAAFDRSNLSARCEFCTRSFARVVLCCLCLHTTRQSLPHRSQLTRKQHQHHAKTTTTTALLFSWPYAAAMACAAAEYGLTAALAPGLKQTLLNACSIAGLVVLCAGEALRKAAMLTARGAFTHDIQRRRREGHELVDWGVYRCVEGA